MQNFYFYLPFNQFDETFSKIGKCLTQTELSAFNITEKLLKPRYILWDNS